MFLSGRLCSWKKPIAWPSSWIIFPTLHLKDGLPIVNFCSLSPPRPTREAQLKKKKKTRRENLDFIKPTLSLSYLIRAFQRNDLHVGSNYEKSKSLQKSLQMQHFLVIIVIIIIIISLFTLGSILFYSTDASGAEKMLDTNNSNWI